MNRGTSRRSADPHLMRGHEAVLATLHQGDDEGRRPGDGRAWEHQRPRSVKWWGDSTLCHRHHRSAPHHSGRRSTHDSAHSGTRDQMITRPGRGGLRFFKQERARHSPRSPESRDGRSSCSVRINGDAQPGTQPIPAIGTHGHHECGSPNTWVSGWLNRGLRESLFTSLPPWERERRRVNRPMQPTHPARVSTFGL